MKCRPRTVAPVSTSSWGSSEAWDVCSACFQLGRLLTVTGPVTEEAITDIIALKWPYSKMARKVSMKTPSDLNNDVLTLRNTSSSSDEIVEELNYITILKENPLHQGKTQTGIYIVLGHESCNEGIKHS